MATDEASRLTRAERAARLRGLYGVVNGEDDPLCVARAFLEAGACVIQYRAKHGIVERDVHELRRLTQSRDVLLILNDDWRAARELGCDGVHLGPGDEGFTDVARVRNAFTRGIIGLSCGTLAEVRAADAQALDYVGVGAVYATSSKPDAGDPIGIDGLIRIARATHLPVAAIGGITLTNIAEIAASGVAMAAILSAVARAPDRLAAAQALVRKWNDARA
jgi:thiamine-phosphate pyrophosphorylase